MSKFEFSVRDIPVKEGLLRKDKLTLESEAVFVVLLIKKVGSCPAFGKTCAYYQKKYHLHAPVSQN